MSVLNFEVNTVQNRDRRYGDQWSLRRCVSTYFVAVIGALAAFIVFRLELRADEPPPVANLTANSESQSKDPKSDEQKETATVTPEQIEFFETKVRPLLSKYCFECHGKQSLKVKGNLRLDSRAGGLKGGDSGAAIVPGRPADSLLIQAVKWQTFEMPPSGKLSDDKINILSTWVEAGAPWPADPIESTNPVAKSYDWEKLKHEHWSWQPIRLPAVPSVKQSEWPRNEIDHFVLAKLEAAGLSPNPPATPAVLLRRINLDLIGLPPTPEEVQEFEAAAAIDQPVAVSRLVERLLESPLYGERWGRHWLDVARYSDGYGGFLDGAPLPNAWRYRDWVIAALNRDMPYPEFIRLQLAGDLIAAREHGVATGFLALGPTYISDGGDPDATAQAKSETLDDRVDTMARGLMALTVACARCHDHRFDPIPQVDYYSLAGVFNNTANRELPLVEADVVALYDKAQQELAALKQRIDARKGEAKKQNRELTTEEQVELKKWEAEWDRLSKSAPEKYPVAHAMADSGANDMAVAIRGNLRRPGEIAPRRFLQILSEAPAPRFKQGSGRLELVEAIISPENPLTARVLVNRVWLNHFGQALVRTPSNFGILGEKPTHPELLDWLAAKLNGTGAADFRGSLKHLHRVIISSASYQMDSAPDAQAFAVDGDNRLIWRMNPRRLDVEAWRDALLFASGELDLTRGGPSIENIADSHRRTLYAAISRNGDRFPSDTFLRQFDFPSARATNEGRTSSIVPQQSLFLMNSSLLAARARGLSRRLFRESGNVDDRIRRAYLLLYSRSVTVEELQLGRDFLSQAEMSGTPSSKLNAWEQYAQVLLSASELMFWE